MKIKNGVLLQMKSIAYERMRRSLEDENLSIILKAYKYDNYVTPEIARRLYLNNLTIERLNEATNSIHHTLGNAQLAEEMYYSSFAPEVQAKRSRDCEVDIPDDLYKECVEGHNLDGRSVYEEDQSDV